MARKNRYFGFLLVTAAVCGGTMYVLDNKQEVPKSVASPAPIREQRKEEKKVEAVAPSVDVVAYADFFDRYQRLDVFMPLDAQTVSMFRAHVLKLLDEYKNATPRTFEIFTKTATRLGFTAYDGKVTVGELKKRGGQELLVVLLNEPGFNALLEEQRGTFAYIRGRGLIYAPAIYCPDVFTVAVIFHELGHLLLDEEGFTGVRSQRQPVGTDEYFEEEVEMAELEGKVLDFAVHGALAKLLDQIIDRSGAMGSGGKYSLVHHSVTPSDLQQFETMFGLEQTGRIIAATALTEFRLLLDFRFIERAYSGSAGPMVQKVSRYKWTRKK